MTIKKNTLWNLVGSIGPMLIGIAVIPYIYKHVGIERIGILTIIWALIGYFSIFDFGLGRAITQRIASLATKNTGKEKEKIATTGAFLTLVIGMIGGLSGLLAVELVGVRWMNSTPNLDHEVSAAFLLACLAIPATTTTAGLRGVLEGEQRFKVINLLKIILGLSNFISPVISILFYGPRLDYIVASLVATRYLMLFAHYSAAKCEINGKYISREESSHLFKFGGWMTLSNIISPLMVVADRFLLAHFLGAAVVAYYTVPAEFMIRLLVIPAAITATLFPIFSNKLSMENHEGAFSLYKKSMKFIFMVMSAVVLCIFIVADFGIKFWLGPEFSEKSTSVVYIFAVGVLFNSLAQIPHAYIQASGDARSTALIHLFESILYLPVLIILIGLHGILGAAVAWGLRALLDLALLHLKSMRINK